MEYFETHAHYDDEKFNGDREETIKKIYESGVTKCVNVGCSIETSKKSVEFAKKYDFIYAICGIHPSEIPQTEEQLWKNIAEIENIVTSNKKIVAIGEIGLDYHYEGYNKEMQQKAFIEQIKLANKLGLPVSIHTRDAIDDTIAILLKNKILNGGILHCCPFNKELVRHGIELGFYIAFGGTCTFKNSKNAKEILNMVPDDKILIETDSPYLAPEPFRGTRNDSSNLKYIVEKIAEYKNDTPENVAKYTYNNAMRIFERGLKND